MFPRRLKLLWSRISPGTDKKESKREREEQAFAVLEGEQWLEKGADDLCGWDYYYIDLRQVKDPDRLFKAINSCPAEGEYRSSCSFQTDPDHYGRYCVPKNSLLGLRIKTLLEAQNKPRPVVAAASDPEI